MQEVPGNRLPLAVRVSRQVNLLGSLHARLEILHNLGLVTRNQVLRREIVVDIDAELALGQVPDVPHRRLDLESPSQVLLDGPGLGGRLDDDELSSWGGLFGGALARSLLLWSFVCFAFCWCHRCVYPECRAFDWWWFIW